jgi:uncharacterized protein (UPF0303 family)
MSTATEPDASVVRSFTDDDAWELGALMRADARLDGLPVCIDISRPTGTTLFHASLPGATVDDDGWAARKAAVVYRFEVCVGASSLGGITGRATTGRTATNRNADE